MKGMNISANLDATRNPTASANVAIKTHPNISFAPFVPPTSMNNMMIITAIHTIE